MLYSLLRLISRLTFRIYCRNIIINNPEALNTSGPVLLAVNHPNSFLDSILINTVIETPVWSLARGDVFKKPLYAKLLRSLRILPVYRTTEGADNLERNYHTFQDCLELFRNKQIVCIYSEGLCVNEWRLRPLKKGTARLAFMAWEQGIPLRILPVGINYHSYRSFGKNVILNVGSLINPGECELAGTDGQRYQQFNAALENQLKQLVMHIDQHDITKQKELLGFRQPLIKKIALALPALAGTVLHAPLYVPLRRFALKRTADTGHFDSVLTALLLVLYPLYLLLFIALAFLFRASWWSLILIPVIPFLAWSTVQLKKQF